MSVTIPNENQLQRILNRGVADVIIEAEFVKLLKSGRKLRLKKGFDPSAPDIHLGHVVGLRKLRELQELGHQVVLIVGDWTAQIGDPSGRSATRPMLSAKEVAANAETYMSQLFKVVDREKTEVRWQTEWFGEFSLAEVIRLTSRFTVAQILKRDDFAKRYEADQPIAVTELLYPLLQAYDSTVVQADVEFGGTDQRFNNLLGRELQEMVGQPAQQVMLVPILVGTDGVQKMSKSLGNYIGVDDPPNDMFGKAMSIQDEHVASYLELLTNTPDNEITELREKIARQSVNPMSLKKRLATDLVSQFHGQQEATEAQNHFESVIQRREEPQDIPKLELSFNAPSTGPNPAIISDNVASARELEINVVKLLVKTELANSSSEARRLIAQGAVRVGGRQLAPRDLFVSVKPNTTIRVGNRKFIQIVDSD